MLAKLKDKTAYLKEARFNWELKVIKKSKDKQSVKLSNWLWYCSIHLELKKESWGSRYRKPKQEVIKKEEGKKKEIEIDIWRVNMELKVWEYETKIKQLNKECESWMIDLNKIKREKLDFENKYNFWKALFLINISINIIYLLIIYLWI